MDSLWPFFQDEKMDIRFFGLLRYMEDVDEHVLKDSKNGVGRGDSVRSPPPKPFLEMKVPQRKVMQTRILMGCCTKKSRAS